MAAFQSETRRSTRIEGENSLSSGTSFEAGMRPREPWGG